jgi:hypothetical protein
MYVSASIDDGVPWLVRQFVYNTLGQTGSFKILKTKHFKQNNLNECQ